MVFISYWYCKCSNVAYIFKNHTVSQYITSYWNCLFWLIDITSILINFVHTLCNRYTNPCGIYLCCHRWFNYSNLYKIDHMTGLPRVHGWVQLHDHKIAYWIYNRWSLSSPESVPSWNLSRLTAISKRTSCRVSKSYWDLRCSDGNPITLNPLQAFKQSCFHHYWSIRKRPRSWNGGTNCTFPTFAVPTDSAFL